MSLELILAIILIIFLLGGFSGRFGGYGYGYGYGNRGVGIIGIILISLSSSFSWGDFKRQAVRSIAPPAPKIRARTISV